MTNQQYYSVFTEQGITLLKDAIKHGTKLDVTHIAFGDGSGNIPIPNPNLIKLINEVYRTQIDSLISDPDNTNWLSAEVILASKIGGFNVRELGLYVNSTLIAYSNYPATYKPDPSDSNATMMTFRMLLQIDTMIRVESEIDPNIVLATIQKVDNSKIELYEKTVNTVDTFADLEQIEKWDGRTVKIRGYYPATNFALAQPYKGGATYIYSTSTKSWNIQITDGYIDVYMFGAKADYSEKTMGGTDDQPAIMQAIDTAIANNVYVVHFPQGDYYTKGTINPAGSYPEKLIPDIWGRGVNGQLTAGVFLQGAGRLLTNIYFEPQTDDHVGLKIERSTGVASRMGVDGISITPASWTGRTMNNDEEYQKPLKGIGLELADQCFSTVHNIFIGAFNDGIRLSNNWGFCEFNRFDNIHIDYATNCIHYYFNGGYESFHGNSWNNTMIQLRKGGIGIKVSKSGIVNKESQTQAYIYHNLFNINAYGETDAYIFRSYNGTVATCQGTITVEGRNAWRIDNAIDFFELSGSLNALQHGDPIFECSDRSVFENTANQYDADQSFRFSNQSESIAFSGKYAGINRTLSNTTTANSLYQPRVFTKDPDIIKTQDGGLGFLIRGSNITGWDFLAFGGTEGKTRNGYLKHAIPIWNLSGNDGTLTAFYKDIVLFAKTADKTRGLQLSHDFEGFFPQQDDTISLGIGALRYKSLFTTNWEVSSAGILPRKAATNNIASAALPLNNVYSQNAVTVVSDERQKNDISELTQQELECAIACGKLYRRYKLNKATQEKGDQARFHIGVISQDIVKCFNDHGLDWKQYGVVIYEKWDAIQAIEYQSATYDEQGNQVTPEIQAVEGRDGGEIYMVRYEELNCFINAGLEYRLSQLEKSKS